MILKRTIVCFSLIICNLAFSQETDFQLNTNFNYRTISGNEGGNFIDISARPTLSIEGLAGAQFFINVPYNLSTNQIRKEDLKIGNAFRYAYIGNEQNFIKPSALEGFTLGYSSLVVNGYNNQIDETNRKIGLLGGIDLGSFNVKAMTNDIGNPEVFTGSIGFKLPLMDLFDVSITGGYDSNPDNNKDTKENVSVYGVDLRTAYTFDNNANNYFYLIAGAAEINKHGNGQVGMAGFRFGTGELFLDISGALMRLGPGFEWGFFDTYYERGRKLGVNKADLLDSKYSKASGGTNLGAFLGYATDNPNNFSLQFGGYYFTNYSGSDLNKFDAAVQLYVPRTIIGDEGELVSATFYVHTQAFENISGLFDQLTKPDNRTVLSLDVPITLLNDVMGLGRLAFVLNYNWSFAYDGAVSSYIPQKNLITGLRLISNISQK